MSNLHKLADEWDAGCGFILSSALYSKGYNEAMNNCAAQLRAELAKMPTLDDLVKELHQRAYCIDNASSRTYSVNPLAQEIRRIADRIEQAIAAPSSLEDTLIHALKHERQMRYLQEGMNTEQARIHADSEIDSAVTIHRMNINKQAIAETQPPTEETKEYKS